MQASELKMRNWCSQLIAVFSKPGNGEVMNKLKVKKGTLEYQRSLPAFHFL
ncbi:MAG TPA: hypothetical protein VFZ42_10930 [Chitinophagaceae bacterium]